MIYCCKGGGDGGRWGGAAARSLQETAWWVEQSEFLADIIITHSHVNISMNNFIEKP
jgi:hypothetical protein